jgi:hypothetical protein
MVRLCGSSAGFDAYDEEAFRYFLGVEQKRADRSGRIVLLLLVELELPSGLLPLATPLADRLFSALAAAVREMDFVGWYSTGYVAGAVLVQAVNPLPPVDRNSIGARVGVMLREALPPGVGDRLQIRVVHTGIATRA